MFKRINLIGFLSVLYLAAASSAYADPNPVYEKLSRQGAVSIYVENVVDATKDKKLDVAGLKTEIEKALAARKSIQFKVVNQASEAEYTLNGSIKDFGWSDHDPVDMLMGTAAIAVDAAKVEDYAFMIGDFSLKETKSGQLIWKNEVRATVTKGGMSEKDSLPLINEDMADILIRSAFGKKKI